MKVKIHCIRPCIKYSTIISQVLPFTVSYIANNTSLKTMPVVDTKVSLFLQSVTALRSRVCLWQTEGTFRMIPFTDFVLLLKKWHTEWLNASPARRCIYTVFQLHHRLYGEELFLVTQLTPSVAWSTLSIRSTSHTYTWIHSSSTKAIHI